MMMFSIQAFLICQSKLPITYKHLSQAESYQIHALIKAGHDQSQIAKVRDRNKSTISRESSRNTGSRGYRPSSAMPLNTIEFVPPVMSITQPLSEQPMHIEARRRVVHWKCDTAIVANHKGAVVTIVERKSGYAVVAKVEKKNSELVSSAIVD